MSRITCDDTSKVIGKEQEEEGESFGLGRMSDDGANPHNTTGRKYASFIR